jgi:hypothetical protein
MAEVPPEVPPVVDPLGVAPMVAQAVCYGSDKPVVGDAGLHLFFCRLPTREERHGLLAVARGETTPAARRKAFVVGTLCMPDGTPQVLPTSETDKLDRLTLDEWDEVLIKAAHLNGFAPLQVIAD